MFDQCVGLRTGGTFAQHFFSGDQVLVGKLELKILFVLMPGYRFRQVGKLGKQT